MFESRYCTSITNIIKIGEKFVYQNINKNDLIDKLDFKQLEITFRIPSKIQYEHGFIALLMLTEKMHNLTPIFLLDKNTLSKKKTIKVGLVLTIRDESIIEYLEICCMHSVPKFYEYGISFSIKNKKDPFAYKLNKILSNTIFSFDKDINSFYNYLGESEYEYDFLFSTFFKSILMNKLLISSKGFSFINVVDQTKVKLINEVKEKVALEELEELEELKKTNYEAYLEELKLNEELNVCSIVEHEQDNSSDLEEDSKEDSEEVVHITNEILENEDDLLEYQKELNKFGVFGEAFDEKENNYKFDYYSLDNNINEYDLIEESINILKNELLEFKNLFTSTFRKENIHLLYLENSEKENMENNDNNNSD